MFYYKDHCYCDEEIQKAIQFWEGEWITANTPRPPWFEKFYQWLGTIINMCDTGRKVP